MPLVSKQEMYKDIGEWFKVAEELERISGIEKEMRVNLFNKYFATNPNTEEGTNHIALEFGKLLSADYRINRKIDEAQLDASLALGLIERPLVDELFNYKPALRIGEWKKSPPETRLKFAEIITETPGTPGLKIVTPKR